MCEIFGGITIRPKSPYYIPRKDAYTDKAPHTCLGICFMSFVIGVVSVRRDRAGGKKREQGILTVPLFREWGEKISRLLAGGALGELTVPDFGFRSGCVSALAHRKLSIVWRQQPYRCESLDLVWRSSNETADSHSPRDSVITLHETSQWSDCEYSVG
jgi:hypothetical protein